MAYSAQALLDALKSARSKDLHLISTIDLHCALLEAEASVSLPDLPPLPAVEVANGALAAGHPLIELTTLPLDSPALLSHAGDICDITAHYWPDLAGGLAVVRRYVEGDGLQDEGTVDDGLLAFVLNHGRRPLLRAWTERLSEMVDISDWRGPICPFCGGPPDMGAFDADTGKRHLLCSHCDTEWAFSRIGCPFCQNNDPRHLAYFPGEDERYRLYVCDACHRYLKMVDLRQMARKVMLPVERVLTMDMDLAARQAGYT